MFVFVEQNYSSTCDNTLIRLLSGLIANFYHLMLVINSIKSKYHDLTNIYLKKCIRYEFFDAINLKSSNIFAADSIKHVKTPLRKSMSSKDFFPCCTRNSLFVTVFYYIDKFLYGIYNDVDIFK